jgi:hypothetical protein
MEGVRLGLWGHAGKFAVLIWQQDHTEESRGLAEETEEGMTGPPEFLTFSYRIAAIWMPFRIFRTRVFCHVLLPEVKEHFQIHGIGYLSILMMRLFW